MGKPVALCRNALLSPDSVRLYAYPADTWVEASSVLDGHTSTSVTSNAASARVDLVVILPEETEIDCIAWIGEGFDKFDTMRGAYREDGSNTTISLDSIAATNRGMIMLDDSINAKILYLQCFLSSGTHTLKLHQVSAGMRVDLPRHPALPFDPKNTAGLVSDFVSSSGVMTRSTFYTGRAELEIAFHTANDAEAELVESVHALSGQGSSPIFWITDKDKPNDVIFGFVGTDFSQPYTNGPATRETTLSIIEQGPKFLSQEG
ncbi:MAG: hypothetical protein CMF70_06980 [Magnetovibrio sp.]|nr:hypothetical protein [Magnetovibrio sp.]|tara:strand:- start:4321 stop:5106 length:786 start_codon:yes stop_codon:yes gene_type:complete